MVGINTVTKSKTASRLPRSNDMKPKRIEFDGRRHLPLSDEVAAEFAAFQKEIGNSSGRLSKHEKLDVVFLFDHNTRLSSAAEKRIRNIQWSCAGTSANVFGEFTLQTSAYKDKRVSMFAKARDWCRVTIFGKVARQQFVVTGEERLWRLLSLASFCLDAGIVKIDKFDQKTCHEQSNIIDTYANNWAIVYPLVTPLPTGMVPVNDNKMAPKRKF